MASCLCVDVRKCGVLGHALVCICRVPPAFQWAQSPVEVFLNIKFAYRWSSPGKVDASD